LQRSRIQRLILAADDFKAQTDPLAHEGKGGGPGGGPSVPRIVVMGRRELSFKISSTGVEFHMKLGLRRQLRKGPPEQRAKAKLKKKPRAPDTGGEHILPTFGVKEMTKTLEKKREREEGTEDPNHRINQSRGHAAAGNETADLAEKPLSDRTSKCKVKILGKKRPEDKKGNQLGIDTKELLARGQSMWPDMGRACRRGPCASTS